MSRLRIISGVWRSRLLEFPDAEGLRPTPDRVRETLFNWLGQTLHGKTALDLFAGSGALGFEALSRGADSVVMVEADRNAVLALRQNAAKLEAQNLQIRHGDALHYLTGTSELFDVVFLDPPFKLELLDPLLLLLPRILRPGGRVYVEHDKPLVLDRAWQKLKESRAGQVHFGLLCLASPD